MEENNANYDEDNYAHDDDDFAAATILHLYETLYNNRKFAGPKLKKVTQ